MAKKPKHFMFDVHALDFLYSRVLKHQHNLPTNTSIKEAVLSLRAADRGDYNAFYETIESLAFYRGGSETILSTIVNDLGLPGFRSPEGKQYTDEGILFVQNKLLGVSALRDWVDQGKFQFLVAPNLCTMLRHTKLDNFPTNRICLPQKSFSIVPSLDGWSRSFRADNSYSIWSIAKEDTPLDSISWVTLESGAWLFTLYRYVTTPNGITLGAESMRINPDKYATLGDMFKGVKSSGELEFACAVAIYATTVDADSILAENSPEYREWAKKIKKLPEGNKRRGDILRKLSRAQGSKNMYLGGKIRLNRHGSKGAKGGSGTHASPRAHWRMGHIRRIPNGNTVFIQPTIVNMSASDCVVTRDRELQ